MKNRYKRLWVSGLLLISTLAGYGQSGGIITTERTGRKGLVSFTSPVPLSEISNGRHVNGYVKKYGNGPFVFPVGHQGAYRPFGADAGGTLGAYFGKDPSVGSLADGGPFPATSKDNSVGRVSTREFWDVDGASATRLTLTWNAASALGELTGENISLLSIVGWNPATARWEKITSVVDDQPIQGGTSSLEAGSITTVQRIVPDFYRAYTLAALTSAGLPVNYRGKLETVDCRTVTGWAWDQNYPNAALTVELVEGTTVHASAVASLYRQDLADAGTGTGSYGFRLPLPASLIDGNTHAVSVRVRGSTYALTNSPQSVTCGHRGELEAVSCETAQGWAWDQNHPDEVLTVELVEGNTVYGTAPASGFREDLKSKGIGTGQYGFTIPLPAGFKDGKEHQLSVRVNQVDYKLAGSPKTIRCAEPQYLGRVEGLDCKTVVGWVWDRNNPQSTLTVELVEGNTVWATATANTFLAGLKNEALGSTGYYGFSLSIPAALKDGQHHQVSLRVKGSTYQLTESVRTLNCAANEYLGRMEGLNCEIAVGWVWDRNNPNAALTVELVENDIVYAAGTANLYLVGLKNEAMGSTGYYGFGIPIPRTLKDGNVHQLSARVKGSQYALTDSPRSLQCAANQYLGRVEGLDCKTVVGWVWDRNNPQSTLTVELVEGNTVWATATANTFLAGLKNEALGSTGYYGFSLSIPAALKDGQHHQVSLRVKGSTYQLTESVRTLNCAANEYLGRMEGLNCEIAVGWVWDRNNPNAALTVELLEGNTVLATAPANGYLDGLRNEAMGSTGYYGFALPVPASLRDGKPHQLSTRVQASSYVLTNSPQNITCSSSVGRLSLVNAENPEWKLGIAPNPSTGKLEVTFGLEDNQKALLRIVDRLGRVVWQLPVEGKGGSYRQTIDLSQQLDGVYFLQLQKGSHREAKHFILLK
ncbi:T9SS type A sorting domain-containing protein [Larkinella insperata]|uniref:T9SS type A sorting domain-containing protein n=1 Tax=Larkinella insperata TaxID=332158 RepID=A0ABW3PWJ6_9BACT|nr:T9SS type A sorting domain-containing protein [Larkinella insperata]